MGCTIVKSIVKSNIDIEYKHYSVYIFLLGGAEEAF